MMYLYFVMFYLGAKEIDIAATLEHIRDQRMMMVKTKVKYVYWSTTFLGGRRWVLEELKLFHNL